MTSRLATYLWSALTMLAALALTLSVAREQQVYVAEHNIVSPDYSVTPVLLYFFGVVAVMVVILFFIPLDKLKWVFRILFTIMYGWGGLVIGFLFLPEWTAWILAVIVAGLWLFYPRVWVQNLVLLIALSAAGSVFGYMLSPWTFMIFIGIIAVYDLLAVRFGLMVWMADQLSETTTLPAFVYPKHLKDWGMKLSTATFGNLKDQEPAAREYSILGGGDIGFPLMLTVSVYFLHGAGPAWLVGLFALVGLMMAYVIQSVWLKGKPMPAMPPIAVFSLIGWLIVWAWMT